MVCTRESKEKHFDRLLRKLLLWESIVIETSLGCKAGKSALQSLLCSQVSKVHKWVCDTHYYGPHIYVRTVVQFQFSLVWTKSSSICNTKISSIAQNNFCANWFGFWVEDKSGGVLRGEGFKASQANVKTTHSYQS